jgi:transcriptional regulator with XRE-family HTH domain
MDDKQARSEVVAHQTTLGTLLRHYRSRGQVTQGQLADLSGVSVRAIRDIELERSQQPRRTTVRLLADSLALSGSERAKLEAAAGQFATSDELHLVYESEPMSPPSPIDTILGRGAEVAILTNVLGSGAQRLVTITGLTGVGKTRLALETATTLHRTHGFAVLWNSSDPLYPTSMPPSRREHDQLSNTIRTGLDGLFARFRLDSSGLDPVIVDHPTLVVLDGYDVADIRLDQLLRLLRRCPGVRVLMTSPARLGVRGERAFPLVPLPVPELAQAAEPADLARVPSVAMLVDRAREYRPDFSLVPGNAEAVAGLVQAVDGLPVAVQAVGSWFAMFEPEALFSRVVADPFAFLAGYPGTDRSDGLVARLTSSVSGTDGDERRLLTELADWQGWTVDDAARLTGIDPANCARAARWLLDTGLVRPAPGTGRSRFQVLNLVRSLRPQALSLHRNSVPPNQWHTGTPDAPGVATAGAPVPERREMR